MSKTVLCIKRKDYYYCPFDDIEIQETCKYYEKPLRWESMDRPYQWCRFNWGSDGKIGDHCLCPDAQREAN